MRSLVASAARFRGAAPLESGRKLGRVHGDLSSPLDLAEAERAALDEYGGGPKPVWRPVTRGTPPPSLLGNSSGHVPPEADKLAIAGGSFDRARSPFLKTLKPYCKP